MSAPIGGKPPSFNEQPLIYIRQAQKEGRPMPLDYGPFAKACNAMKTFLAESQTWWAQQAIEASKHPK